VCDPSGPRPEGLVKDDSVAQHVRVDHKLLLAFIAEDGQNGANGIVALNTPAST